MENTANTQFFSDTRKKLEKYLADRWLLVKLEVTEKGGRVSTLVLTAVLVFFGVFCLLFFLSVLLAYVFAGLFNSVAAGFGSVTALYLLLLLLVWFSRHAIIRKVQNIVIASYFTKKIKKDGKQQELRREHGTGK